MTTFTMHEITNFARKGRELIRQKHSAAGLAVCTPVDDREAREFMMDDYDSLAATSGWVTTAPREEIADFVEHISKLIDDGLVWDREHDRDPVPHFGLSAELAICETALTDPSRKDSTS
ncbi:MAG TPA: hypothetical protein VHR72_11155 [Gemmataceae bacterium]|jgi:hypothetical protein|nr:hypothetical protein [Gemmataceae bacterium]